MKATLLALILTVAALSASARDSISASMSVSGRFAERNSWQLAIADDGASKLTVELPGTPARKSFQIPVAKLDELRELLLRERFFDLRESYGDSVPDGSTTTITARLGSRRKTVDLRYLRNEDSRLDEIQRAVRVSIFLRGLFEHPDAVDLRRYDKMMLKDSPK